MFPLLLRCICRYLCANMLTALASVKRCFKVLGVCLMKLKAHVMPLEKNSNFFSDGRFFQSAFWLGRIWDLVSVYMVLFDVQTGLLEMGFSTLYATCNFSWKQRSLHDFVFR